MFKSNFQILDRAYLDSRWNIGYVSNLIVGKVWQRQKTATLARTIGVSIRGVWSGSPREPEINYGSSQNEGQTVYYDQDGYLRKYAGYYRADIRLYWTRSIGNQRSSSIAFDLQNITNHQNLAHHYYDAFSRGVESKYQLGTIPNFSWSVMF